MSGDPEVAIRRATPSDAEALARLRVELSRSDEGTGDESEVRAYHARCVAYFARELAHDGDLFAWVAVCEGEIVASAAMLVHQSLPRRHSRDSPRGVPLDARIRSVYVVEFMRRRGIARALVLAAIAHARELGCHRITLGASQMGKPLYDSLGFEVLEREMSLAVSFAGPRDDTS